MTIGDGIAVFGFCLFLISIVIALQGGFRR